MERLIFCNISREQLKQVNNYIDRTDQEKTQSDSREALMELFEEDELGDSGMQKMDLFENKEIKQRKTELSLRPDDPEAHFNLGTAYDKAGKIRKAILEFEKTIKIHSNSAEAHFNLGCLLYTSPSPRDRG